MWHLGSILGHPVVNSLSERRLRPSGVDSGGSNAVILECCGPLVSEHVQSGLGDGVSVELACHEESDVRGGENGGYEDDSLEFGLLDEGKESARDAKRSDSAERNFIREFVKVSAKEYDELLCFA